MLENSFLVFVAVVAAILKLSYGRYRSQSAWLKRTKIFGYIDDLEGRILKSKRQISATEVVKQNANSAIFAEYLDRVYQKVPIESLKEAPSIDPQTIQSLRMVGYFTLADFVRFGMNRLRSIPNNLNISPNTVREAIFCLQEKCGHELMNGQHPESQSMQEQMLQTNFELDLQVRIAQSEIRRAASVHNLLKPLEVTAKELTYFRWLLNPSGFRKIEAELDQLLWHIQRQMEEIVR